MRRELQEAIEKAKSEFEQHIQRMKTPLPGTESLELFGRAMGGAVFDLLQIVERIAKQLEGGELRVDMYLTGDDHVTALAMIPNGANLYVQGRRVWPPVGQQATEAHDLLMGYLEAWQSEGATAKLAGLKEYYDRHKSEKEQPK